MSNTPNYGWDTPDNTGLVKNGALDMRTLGNAIDTSVWNVGYGQAGKNKIINGDFGIWQRGTSFSNPAQGVYTADRWRINFESSTAPTTATLSQQTFTPGTAPVADYEGKFFWRYAVTTKGGSATYFETKTRIEDVRTFAGQTATYSFWAKADSARTLSVYWEQRFGSGGSPDVLTSLNSVSVTTAWARYSVTISVPSISGKTIGAGSTGAPSIRLTMADGMTLDLWGMQVEAGSVATPFQTASGSIAGELALAQRYYQRFTVSGGGNFFGVGFNESTTSTFIKMPFPVIMRTAPTALEQSGTAGDYSVRFTGTGNTTCSAVPTFSAASTHDCTFIFTVASGLTGGQSVMGRALNSSAFLGWSAEL